MKDSAHEYREKALQCRRLIAAIDDKQAIAVLAALAAEFDAKRAAAEACVGAEVSRVREDGESPPQTLQPAGSGDRL